MLYPSASFINPHSTRDEQGVIVFCVHVCVPVYKRLLAHHYNYTALEATRGENNK